MDSLLEYKALPNIDGESNDAVKKFTNIDKEDFEFTYVIRPGEQTTQKIKAGETVDLPKYKVNFAAFHLAKKVVKREAIEEFQKKFPKHQLGRADISVRNEEKEKELQQKMVAANFLKTEESKESEEKEESKIEKKPVRKVNK